MEKEMTEVNLEENNIDNEENLDVVENVALKERYIYDMKNFPKIYTDTELLDCFVFSKIRLQYSYSDHTSRSPLLK